MHSDDPLGPGLSRARAARLGLAFATVWKTGDWTVWALLPRHFLGPNRKTWPRRARPEPRRSREEVEPPALPAPPTPSQPLGPTLRGVIGSGGRRRAGGDSRETARLSAAICLSGRDRPGRCGPGSSRPRPPPQPDPGPRGSWAWPLNGAGWRQGSGRRGSGREARDGKQLCLSFPPLLPTHTTLKDQEDAPSGTFTTGHTHRATHVTQA